MKNIIKKIYRLIGYFLYGFHYLFFKINLKPIKENKILFVAHPDDEVLFFHTVLKKEKPYVVLLTSGFSLIRLKEFKSAMKYYGLNYNYYCLKTRDDRDEKIEKIIKKELERGSFSSCFSHSKSGEYGHVMHSRVGNAVLKHARCEVLSPVSAEKIENEKFKLNKKDLNEKTEVFKSIYKSQLFVLDEYKKWVEHERVEAVKK